jgi:hypothetical protein
MMKAITHKGTYSPIVRNNGCEVTLLLKNGKTTFEQVVSYSEFSERQQKMLARNKTHTDYRTVTNVMTGATVQEAVDLPYSCSVSNEAYWCN